MVDDSIMVYDYIRVDRIPNDDEMTFYDFSWNNVEIRKNMVGKTFMVSDVNYELSLIYIDHVAGVFPFACVTKVNHYNVEPINPETPSKDYQEAINLILSNDPTFIKALSEAYIRKAFEACDKTLKSDEASIKEVASDMMNEYNNLVSDEIFRNPFEVEVTLKM